VSSLLLTLPNVQEFIQNVKLCPCLSTPPWKRTGGKAPCILDHFISCISQNYLRRTRPDRKSVFLNKWGKADRRPASTPKLMRGASQCSSTNTYGEMLRQRNNVSSPSTGQNTEEIHSSETLVTIYKSHDVTTWKNIIQIFRPKKHKIQLIVVFLQPTHKAVPWAGWIQSTHPKIYSGTHPQTMLRIQALPAFINSFCETAANESLCTGCGSSRRSSDSSCYRTVQPIKSDLLSRHLQNFPIMRAATLLTLCTCGMQPVRLAVSGAKPAHSTALPLLHEFICKLKPAVAESGALHCCGSQNGFHKIIHSFASLLIARELRNIV
jgi:hypothetical protein